MKNKFIHFTFFLFFSCFSFSQNVRSKLDKTEIEIGNPITLSIEASVSNNEKVQFPILKDSISKNLEILSIKYDTLKNNGKIIVSQHITFTSFEGGKQYINPLIIKMDNGVFATPIFTIEVLEPNVPDNAKINPIKDIYANPLSFWDKIVDFFSHTWVIIVFGLLFLVLIIWFIYKVFFKNKKPKTKNIELTDAEIALQKIDFLELQKLMELGQVKKHYSDLILILKEYMGNRFSFSAIELISSDVIYYLKDKKLFDKKEEDDLLEIFNSADLAKFAKSEPSLEDSKTHLEMAKNFVNSSKPKEIVEPEIIKNV